MIRLRTQLEQNLGWITLAVLLAACCWVMLPFFSALLWGVVLSYSSWPLFCRLLRWCGGRQTVAALLVALGMICVILLPVVIVVASLADNVREVTAAAQRWFDSGLPKAPAWFSQIPVFGSAATERWNALTGDSARLLEITKRLIEPVTAWVLLAGMNVGRGLIELTLSILVTFLLLRHGVSAAGYFSVAIDRIAGARGQHLLLIAGHTVRGVVYGILGTALVQSALAGIGFALAGVPGPALLALLVFPLSVVPAGPFLIMLPAAFWLFHQDATAWGVFMLIWAVFVSTVDNFVKPWLISRGSAIPFLLIFFGVIGGALAFGFIGVFIGPTLLAVGYRIVGEWISSTDSLVPSPSMIERQS